MDTLVKLAKTSPKLCDDVDNVIACAFGIVIAIVAATASAATVSRHESLKDQNPQSNRYSRIVAQMPPEIIVNSNMARFRALLRPNRSRF
jgi:hypothetical protein